MTPREHTAPSLTAAQVAQLAQGELVGDGAVRLSGLQPLDKAGPGDLSFLTNNKYLAQFRATKAGAVLVAPDNRGAEGGPATRIVVKNPHRAMLDILRQLFPEPPRPTGVDATARIGRGAVLGEDVYLGPGAVVGAGARIGRRTVLMAHVVVGDGATVGDDCTLHPHVTLYPRAVLGNRVILHAGVSIAVDGFGYQKAEDGMHERIPHIGRAVIEDDVEIGANSTIDRGSVTDTVIGAGTKIDNLVHVAHNVRIGKRCLLMAMVGVAGSVVVEDDVILAGQAGVSGHLTIGKGAMVAAQSGIIGNVEPGAVISGYPARDHRALLREVAAVKKLAPIARDLEKLVQRGMVKRGRDETD